MTTQEASNNMNAMHWQPGSELARLKDSRAVDGMQIVAKLSGSEDHYVVLEWGFFGYWRSALSGLYDDCDIEFFAIII